MDSINLPTVAAGLHQATQRLAPTSPTAALDARVLLAYVLDCTQASLLARGNEHIDQVHLARFNQFVERRVLGEPVAYLVGEREFYGLMFKVDHRVLVPRPETELLVERGLQWLNQYAPSAALVADIGTGSGCIAVAIAKHATRAQVYAVDVSTDALAVAATNCALHQVTPQVVLLNGSGVEPLPQPVDLILSNPPYTVLSEVDAGVRAFEPHLALDGGVEGLEVYRWLIPACAGALRGGVPTAVMLEIGAWQGQAVQQIAQAAFPRAVVEILQDLAGLDRVVTILNPA